MPRLFSLSFDWSDWRPTKNGTHEVAWNTRTGEKVSFQLHETPPDLPVPIAEVGLVRQFYRDIIAQEGGGLISADVVKAGGLDAIKLVMKYRQAPGTRAVKNIGTLAFVFHECTWSFRVEAEEKGILGIRESAAMTHLRRSVGPEVAVPLSQWTGDAYDPEVQMPFPRNKSDDEEWDEQFPDHSLSRVRKILALVEQTIELDPEVNTLTPFVHPKR